jgi:hypothetical protein
MHGPLNVKIEKCAFKYISNVAVGLNERRESVCNDLSKKLWGKESGKFKTDEIDWKVGIYKICSCCGGSCDGGGGGGGGVSSSSSSSSSSRKRMPK